jgi:predicted nucleic acid-binding protein
VRQLLRPSSRSGGKLGDRLHAPSLLRYEVANATGAWRKVRRVPITLHELEDVPATIAIALKLKRHTAYDASYVALA